MKILFLDDATFENTLLDDENYETTYFGWCNLLKILILDGATCETTYFGWCNL